MKFVRKTYMLKQFNKMVTYAKVNGKTVLIEFTGHRTINPAIKGTFTTSNPEVMEQLEKSKYFKVEYDVYKEEKLEEPEVEKFIVRADPLEVKKQRLIEEEKSKKTEAELAIEAEVQEVVFDPKAEVEPEAKAEPVEEISTEEKPVNPNAVVVKNVQEAKDYLKSQFPELTARQLGNKELVLATAQEKGVEFDFAQ